MVVFFCRNFYGSGLFFVCLDVMALGPWERCFVVVDSSLICI